MRKTRVLIVDDSAIVRKLLADALSSEDDLEVVGTAPDPFVARDKILSLKPDVLTLDIEMPRMDGLTFLKKLMHYQPMPVVVISSLGQAGCQTTFEAMRLGAVEVLAKPGGPYSVGELRMDLAAKVRAAAAARLRKSPTEPLPKPDPPPPAPVLSESTVIAIGASTGGTEAIQEVLMRLPANCPGIVVTQHIPPVFSLHFANRLNEICPMEVKEARNGDTLATGRVLIAPGNFHMLLRKSAGGGLHVSVQDGPRVCYQRPSVDVMFSSVAELMGPRAVGVILTGMGADGARGLLKMKEAGARTIAQDEASCVVFGMPKEAIRMGAADQVTPLTRVPAAILSQLGRIAR
ncbi:MAG: chemotaxis response regulator protein-glutamate methylesterase [Bryobacterales bacterium]|nr:chemotaxis response regulator protein-glutamate methylesterase [Bryobacterales bacterium]